MKKFTVADVKDLDSDFPRIYLDTSELQDAPLWWHEKGLSQTASGYGRKLTTSHKISYNGKLYRIYATCISNVASLWFTVKGKRIYVN
jgi:hypothetical protein